MTDVLKKCHLSIKPSSPVYMSLMAQAIWIVQLPHEGRRKSRDHMRYSCSWNTHEHTPSSRKSFLKHCHQRLSQFMVGTWNLTSFHPSRFTTLFQSYPNIFLAAGTRVPSPDLPKLVQNWSKTTCPPSKSLSLRTSAHPPSTPPLLASAIHRPCQTDGVEPKGPRRPISVGLSVSTRDASGLQEQARTVSSTASFLRVPCEFLSSPLKNVPPEGVFWLPGGFVLHGHEEYSAADHMEP